MQYHGRLLNTWSEIIFDGRGYRLSYASSQPGQFLLSDELGEDLLNVDCRGLPVMTLQRPLPLPLLALVASRIADEKAFDAGAQAEISTPTQPIDEA